MGWRLRALPGPPRVVFVRGKTRESETRCPKGLGHLDPPDGVTWKENLSLSFPLSLLLHLSLPLSLNSAFSSRPLSRSQGYREHV